MKKSKKLMAVMFTVLAAVMIAGTAYAGKSSKTYVPAAGTEYEWNEGKKAWVPSGETFKAAFDQQGRIRSLNISWSDGGGSADSLKYTYEWKGDNLKRESLKYTSSVDGKSGESISIDTKYKVRQKKPVKEKYVCYNYDKNGKLSSSSTTETTYRWNKNNKDGSRVTKTVSREKNDKAVSRSTDSYTLEKGRLSTSWQDNYSFRYYKNGNLKTVTRTGADGKTKDVTEYNKAGYRVKYSHSGTEKNGTVTKNVTTYSWTVTGGKPRSVEWFTRDRNGKVTDRHRYEYTGFRKVKRSRNCDVFGFEVWLGLWGESGKR